jgi:hypothetical protein
MIYRRKAYGEGMLAVKELSVLDVVGKISRLKEMYSDFDGFSKRASWICSSDIFSFRNVCDLKFFYLFQNIYSNLFK